METKKCNKCNEIKSVNDFHKNGKSYYSMCKECKKKYRTENYEHETILRKIRDKNNKELINKQKREYRKGSVYKEYRELNKEKYIKYNKEYYLNNKEKLNKYKTDYIREKRQTNHIFKLNDNIRSSIYRSIKKNGYTKKSRTHEILGCTFDEFKNHLESQFEPWMNWDNYGLYNGEPNYGWDIDHIIPSSSAINEEGVIALNHYTNLQPLCSKVNRDVKRDYF